MVEHWKEVCVLGEGSFGFVRLFVNQKSNDKIALKEMKISSLENLLPTERDKVRERLEKEIEIMREHKHENLVAALKRPQSMHYDPGDNIIHVWMEYCDGGDLRKNGLSLPHNCCGLREQEIRRILFHINAGLIYLHRDHIIHRDLKPENILLKRTPTGEVIYKLADFGYAKSYKQSSFGMSMVGTPQYVAPEILNSQKHGRTVDFWSFGVIVFELCTGVRPFLHLSKRPFDWVNPTCEKPDDCIHIYWPEKGNTPHTSNTIPQPNSLSNVFCGLLTQWLQMALHVSPDKRGGVANDSVQGDAPCLIEMERVLRSKILKMLCMSTGDMLEMRVDSKDNLSSVRQWLKSNGHSNPDTLYFVTRKGSVLCPQDNVQNIYTVFFKDTEEYSAVLYLYSTDLQPSFKLVQKVLPNVTNLLAQGDERIHKDDRPAIYSHAYYHLREFWRLFDMLHSGHNAIMIEIQGMEKELRDIVQKSQNRSLFIEYCLCLGSAEQTTQNIFEIRNKFLDNNDSLKLLEAQCDIEQSMEYWSKSMTEISEKIKEMQCSLDEVQRVQCEAEQLLTTTEVMNQRHICSQKHFDEYNEKYVSVALGYYRMAKADGSSNNMAGLLQVATNHAENIIQDNLNGVDYLSVYLKLSSVVKKAKSFASSIRDIKSDCNTIWPKVCQDMLSLILTSTKRTSTTYVSQISDSCFRPMSSGSRSESVSSTSSAAAMSIIRRLSSFASISGGSIDECEDGNGSDVDHLMDSLKEHISKSLKHSETNMDNNKAILSRLMKEKKEYSNNDLKS